MPLKEVLIETIRRKEGKVNGARIKGKKAWGEGRERD